ncbi:hypothetical protein [Actinorugispora endophytica]|uniref:Agenet domain-containing protein n=1 Tax=Actinorugispora endophytica TaxID=1605990 RepID=A0A4R6UZM9_9ACTN|nr:hypothetical protein [Actinorugispora endophytica]TDQ53066.1 hypothetical protein EV190_105188 [Actinorugispora endophytica]
MMVRRLVSTAVLAVAVFSSLGFSFESSSSDVGNRIECASPWGGETRGGVIIGERWEDDKVSYLVEWDDGRTGIVTRTKYCIVVPDDSGYGEYGRSVSPTA